MTESAPPVVTVVGGVNADICGTPDKRLILRDSNPGKVRLSVGGVGHNIARCLRQMDIPVRFLTAVGRDDYGAVIEQALRACGIDLSGALFSEGDSTSVYLFITDEKGELQAAISDMDICARITPEYLSAHLDEMNASAAVVMDANLPQESIRYIAQHVRVPLFADPVSLAKAEKLRPVLSRLRAVKPNRMVAELLSGVHIWREEDLPLAAAKLTGTGLSRVFISLGGSGVYAASRDEALRLPCCPARLVNSTGGGDAFLAGLVWAELNRLSFLQSARFALACAALNVESRETVSPLLSVDAAMKKMNENQEGSYEPLS